MENHYDKFAKIFKVLSDPKRLEILDLLVSGEMCACKILERFPITQPTLSHDMKLLCDSGIVAGRKEGKWMYYSLAKEGIAELKQFFNQYSVAEETTKSSCCGKRELQN